ncbi:Thiamin pyrophosphokinase 1 [Seminavis robusta]|uniref:Thiamin pyrophosphokinase 1 n=1 Tax=Seminavis robusta TaxID=568900 RepID=A0A9N8DDZ0_9STRA|nr:Thiamin pyrophosphokinase 1 [Seminavis robusta]|eukprot:Sro103_g052470.1 Thiamin pyrophosphokinase 1 (253) ;mRNA; r:47216-48054
MAVSEPMNGHSAGSTTTITHSSPFLPPRNGEQTRQALVILNSPIRSPPSPLFQKLWDSCCFHVCADGGANRLYRADPGLLPDLIRDSNDLDKALSAILQKKSMDTQQQQYTRIIIYGAFGGRFDQEMASIQALYKWGPQFQNRLVLIDDNTSAVLLPAGVKNEIRMPRYGDQTGKQQKDLGEGPTCGLIPIGTKCEKIVTTGFKWNLDGTIPLEFGGLVSTSNHLSEEVATVEASHPLVFTAEVACGIEDVF